MRGKHGIQLGGPVSLFGSVVALAMVAGCSDDTGAAGGDGFTAGESFTGDTESNGDGVDTSADDGDGPCTEDADCVGDPGGPVCVAGACEQCSPSSGLCSDGEYCAADFTCQTGCGADSDCSGDDMCDTASNTCVGCVGDEDCDAGFLCDGASSQCVAGCDADNPCPGSESCCAGMCFDLDSDPTRCGSCDGADAMCAFDMAVPACDMGVCVLDQCDAGFFDCNGDSADGCESDVQCTCTPNEVQNCYSGPANTAGVGKCVAGTQTCNTDGLGFTPCSGEVLPDATEVCGDQIDNDCDGIEDDSNDPDNDGFGLCDGNGNILDCCEDASCAGNTTPEKIGPAAFDFPNDGVDQDCSGADSTALATCDAAITSPKPASDLDYAAAMDICDTTTAQGPGYGVVSVTFTGANGVGSPSADAAAVLDGFGTNITNQAGDRLVVLSTGKADGTGDPEPGTDQGTSSGTPLGITLDAPGSCPTPAGAVFDSVSLEMEVRLPNNAEGFSFDVNYLTADYPERVCTDEIDFFLARSSSQVAGNPTDGNLAVYDDGGTTHQVSANLTKAGLFEDCDDAPTEQCTNGNGTVAYAGCVATTNLAGTGFETVATADTSCKPEYTGPQGAGTGWMRVTGNGNGGELVTLELIIFDGEVADSDSTVLIDNFRWLDTAVTTAGITPL